MSFTDVVPASSGVREARQIKDFSGRIAVFTGGGTGMGREFVRQLVVEGCNVAMCDVFAQAMAEQNPSNQLSRVKPLARIQLLSTRSAKPSVC